MTVIGTTDNPLWSTEKQTYWIWRCILLLSMKKEQAWKVFQGKVNIWNEMWTCEWKVTDKMVKWSDTSENVLRQLQIIQIQHTHM
jgi:hypothetical protein